MEFNNSRSHGEVLAVLTIAAEGIEQRLFFLRPEVDGEPAFRALRSNAEIDLKLRSLARGRPRWFRHGSLGRSVEGRSIPYLHVTDHDSDETKVAVWIDGAIHGFEVASSEVVVSLAESVERQIDELRAPVWLEGIELFLVPVLNVDGRSLCMRPPYALLRNNLHPVDDDGDGRVDEESFVDLNGDGRIAHLHRRGQPFTYESSDADGDGRYGEDLPGGVDLNRDFPVDTRKRPEGWSPQPETRAVVDFWRSHPGIKLAVSYHTSRNMFIEPFVPLADDEKVRYRKLGEHFLRHFPGVAWRMFENPKEYGVARPLNGMSVEWFHREGGATSFILEIGPDEGPRSRTFEPEPLRLADGERATTYRVTGGYYRQVETLLESRLESLRARHAAYLQDLITRFHRGEFE